jgi:hypothetical protein
MAAPIPVKSKCLLLIAKNWLLRNTTTYTWNWQHHLVGDTALFTKHLLLNKIAFFNTAEKGKHYTIFTIELNHPLDGITHTKYSIIK